ncbi:type II secretion system F family protein [Litorihabitans aurantiacus]|uniref:Tight adherence protein B n=1 Tax=Litorihabitans aurantiacus TaxID=1930061 RepID=A0AA37XGA0_9MICO|nr:hypothetical protein [Litorihabitans aurantiacus]GMA32584.1 hypothetical protein GCM10025875_25760 [Litorihabitans aurantiacus]
MSAVVGPAGPLGSTVLATVALVAVALLLEGRWSLVGRGGPRRAGRASSGRRAPAGTRRFRWSSRRRRRPAEPPLGVLCTQVASRLRSGATVTQAWQRALADEPVPVRAGASGVPGAPGLRDDSGVPPPLLALVGTTAAADAVVVACRLAHRCGTPLAEILDGCAHGITEVEAADADRRRALAGPAATARLLGWLPLASLVVGAGLGADPLGAIATGGPAALAVVLGLAFLALGRWWSRRMVRAAQRAGERWDR